MYKNIIYFCIYLPIIIKRYIIYNDRTLFIVYNKLNTYHIFFVSAINVSNHIAYYIDYDKEEHFDCIQI